MTTCTLHSPRIENVIPQIIDELDVQRIDGRIHNVFHAETGDGDVILLAGTLEHVDLLEGGDASISGRYLGVGQGGLPQYLVTEAYQN